MLTTLRNVRLTLPSQAEAGARPFDAFSAGALRLACPFSIVRLPSPPRGGPRRLA